jgi:transcriptional regulator with XRE-family HTH domain
VTTGQPHEPRAQRTRLGNELRRLRTLSGLSGADLGRQVKVSQKTISRIERGEALPSLPQITAWARATSAPDDRLPVLTGLLEAAVNEVSTFREKLTSGLAAVQLGIGELEATAVTIRNFQAGVIPGLLQTAEYARRILDMANIQNDADVAAAVAARLDRQQILYEKTRRFEFLITEAALRWHPGAPELLTAQLDHVSAVGTLDTIELGVIPADAEMHTITRCSFIVYEDRNDGEPPVVAVEVPHALLYASDADDVELYRDQLALFRQSAIYGPDALAFIRSIAHPGALPAASGF